jgi:transketolase N-terminal domain/subunit
MALLNKLERRLIDLSYDKKLSHISSCLGALPILDKLYMVKKPEEPLILSNGHAFAALAVVLEKYEGKDASTLIDKHGTHPNRCLEDGIWASTGSLGQGLPIAVGMALANRERNVYVLASDGEMAEGSMWEAMRIASEKRLENLRLTVTANGLGGYSHIDVDWLDLRMQNFYPSLVVKTNTFRYPDFLNGLDGHYTVMNEEQYRKAITP